MQLPTGASRVVDGVAMIRHQLPIRTAAFWKGQE